MKRLKIIFTSDVHGSLLPVDYATGKGAKGGILSLSEMITRDEETLILDGGDNLQGSPLVQYFLEQRRDYPYHPVAEAFGCLPVDYLTLGNHDFNYGYEALLAFCRAMQEKGSRIICANVLDKRGELGLLPSYVHTLPTGLRVGLVGVVTDFVNVWEEKENLRFLEVSDPLEAARRELAALKGKCDLTVCIYHGGIERDLISGALTSDTRENIACEMADQLEVDILLCGHQHMAVNGFFRNGTLLTEPPDKVGRFVRLQVELEEEGEKEDGSEIQMAAPGDCRIYDREGKTRLSRAYCILSPVERESLTGEKALLAYEHLLPLEEETQRWLDIKVGHLPGGIRPEGKLEAALGGSQVAALLNQVQLEQTGAMISCTSLGNDPVGIPEYISIRDLYVICPFANTLVVKRVTGETLRLALERCASYLELEEGQVRISERFLQPKVEHYNYDFYSGLDYAFDLTRPLGSRVVRLCHLDQTPIGDQEELTLVLNSYRASGTGGYEMLSRMPTIYQGAEQNLDLFMRYVREKKEISIPQNYAFEVLLGEKLSR